MPDTSPATTAETVVLPGGRNLGDALFMLGLFAALAVAIVYVAVAIDGIPVAAFGAVCAASVVIGSVRWYTEDHA